MFGLAKIASVLGALATLASATTYAQFCDDTACTVNCGLSVSVDNPGCLNESGRHSISFHDKNAQTVSLVFSPGPNCPCQNECIENIVAGAEIPPYEGPECYDLSGQALAESFRFIGGTCDGNNC